VTSDEQVRFESFSLPLLDRGEDKGEESRLQFAGMRSVTLQNLVTRHFACRAGSLGEGGSQVTLKT
jgi:hypothetical protein